jgi:hypothetical protein
MKPDRLTRRANSEAKTLPLLRKDRPLAGRRVHCRNIRHPAAEFIWLQTACGGVEIFTEQIARAMGGEKEKIG